MPGSLSPYAHIGDLIAHHAVQQPQAVALLATDRPPSTYRDLANQGHEVARILTEASIDRGDRVAVALANGPEMAAAFLAIAAHAACCPLNPESRQAALEFFLSDLQARALVVPSNAGESFRLPARRLGIQILDVDADRQQRAGLFRLRRERLTTAVDSVRPLERPVHHRPDIAVLLHTSGTTARPKLVPLTHRNVLCSADNIAATLALTPADRCLNVMPLFHIHGLIGAVLSSIAAGASVICSRGVKPTMFLADLERLGGTWYTAVPMVHQAILESTQSSPATVRPNRLRLIRSSSAALPSTVLLQLESTFGVPVIESYGMTEAAHQMASNPLPPRPRKPHSVGVPSGPEIAVINAQGTRLPTGQSGEFVIRGDSVTSGYERNPKATAAAFVDGWFKTGDAGHIDQDGYLFLTGRIKEQINRGGEKVAPLEVEEALLEHAAVAQVVTFAVPHPRLGEDVASAVVLRAGASTDEAGLRSFLFTRLSPAKVPTQIIFVADLPRAATGKLQRIGLHERLAHLLRPDFIPPRTGTERCLVKLWFDVLHAADISVLDNFFSLGGDSLMAARLITRLHEEFAVTLSPAQIFSTPTLASQAVLIDELTGVAAPDGGSTSR